MRRRLVAAAAVLALAGCGGDGPVSAEPTAGTATEPETFTARGTLTLVYGATELDGGGCEGDEGYDDLRAGATVTVTDSSGDKVALGNLRRGEVVKGTYSCEFPFVVEDVPTGDAVYSVEVAGRGEVDFAEAQADRIALSVGQGP